MAAGVPLSPQQPLCDPLRSLRALSAKHPDGWGIATREDDRWIVERSVECAAIDERYVEAARRRATLVIAHVRKRTVGTTTLANTHPFERDGFVFAHNGTVRDIARLAPLTAPEQLARVAGETDSERLFAFVLSHIAIAGEAEGGVTLAVRALHRFGELGSASFLLSCGSRLYAYRSGRSLFTLARDTAVMVASERLTDDPWLEVRERALVVIDTTQVHAIAA